MPRGRRARQAPREDETIPITEPAPEQQSLSQEEIDSTIAVLAQRAEEIRRNYELEHPGLEYASAVSQEATLDTGVDYGRIEETRRRMESERAMLDWATGTEEYGPDEEEDAITFDDLDDEVNDPGVRPLDYTYDPALIYGASVLSALGRTREREQTRCVLCQSFTTEDPIEIVRYGQRAMRNVCDGCQSYSLRHDHTCCETPRADNLVFAYGGTVYCSACAARVVLDCDDCMRNVYLNDVQTVRVGSRTLRYCESCYEGLPRCRQCRTTLTPAQRSNPLCASCQRNVSDFSRLIRPYSANVLDYCQADPAPRNGLLYGVELEVAAHHNHKSFYLEIYNQTMRTVGNDAILKFDRSIDYIHNFSEDRDQEWEMHDWKGFEIVTRPMTYRNQISFWRKFCRERHPALRSSEVGTCGMHVHISRSALSVLETGKLLVFINDQRNRDLITFVARRHEENYALLQQKKLTDARNRHSSGHYDAINLNPQRSPTIEFRIFNGSVNVSTIVANLQFVQSVVEFVTDTGHSQLTARNYLDFVRLKNSSRFRELRAHLDRYKGLPVFYFDSEIKESKEDSK
jgi:hypothetical protein